MDIPEQFHFSRRRLVEFVDTDVSGLVHFANFFRYVEGTEHAFFRSVGYKMHTADGADHQGWPRLEVSCRYFKPARFEDVLEICLRIEEIRSSALRYGYWIFGPEAADQSLLASGSCTIIHVALDTKAQKICKAPVPAELRRKLEQAMAAEAGRDELRRRAG